MTERISKPSEVQSKSTTEPQKKFIFSIEIKKDTDEEVKFQKKDLVNEVNLEKR